MLGPPYCIVSSASIFISSIPERRKACEILQAALGRQTLHDHNDLHSAPLYRFVSQLQLRLTGEHHPSEGFWQPQGDRLSITSWHTVVWLHVVSDHAYDCEWSFQSTCPLFPLWIPSWYKLHMVTMLAPLSVFIECTLNCICVADSWWCRICTFETVSTLDVETDSVSVLLQSYQPFCHAA